MYKVKPLPKDTIEMQPFISKYFMQTVSRIMLGVEGGLGLYFMLGYFMLGNILFTRVICAVNTLTGIWWIKTYRSNTHCV